MVEPATWSPQQISAVAAFRAGLGESDPVKIRNEMAKAPPAIFPDSVKLTPVEIPRVAVPGLEDKARGSIPAEWLEPANATGDEPVVIYGHGGGYCIMSPRSHRGITGGIASHGVRVLSLDYRMAPEHPYPAPIVDALSAYKHVLSQGIPASKICISGDSAGGGLTLATAKYLRDNPSFAPQVAGLAPISPWIDLTASGPTQHLLEEFEADIIGPGRGAVHGMVSAYCGGHDQMHKATEYLVSPIFDKGGPLPPSLASLATVDRLLSMGLAYYARKMTEGETHHVIDVYEDQFHLSIFKLLIREVGGSLTPPPRQQVFQFLTFLPQTSTCLRRIAEFVKTATTNPSSIKPGINTVTYDGEVIPEDRGVEKLKEMLAALNERAEKVGGWDAPHKSVYISAAS